MAHAVRRHAAGWVADQPQFWADFWRCLGARVAEIATGAEEAEADLDAAAGAGDRRVVRRAGRRPARARTWRLTGAALVAYCDDPMRARHALVPALGRWGIWAVVRQRALPALLRVSRDGPAWGVQILAGDRLVWATADGDLQEAGVVLTAPLAVQVAVALAARWPTWAAWRATGSGARAWATLLAVVQAAEPCARCGQPTTLPPIEDLEGFGGPFPLGIPLCAACLRTWVAHAQAILACTPEGPARGECGEAR